MNPSGTVLAKGRHYYYGSALDSLFSAGGFYPVGNAWKTGKEYKTEAFATDGSDNALRRVENTYQQRAHVSWWSGTGYSYELEPAEDARLIESRTTLVDTNQVSTRTLAYDQYNNETDAYEYDFGSGAAGTLLRHTHSDYVTGTNYTDAVSAHLRSLPTQTSVYDAGGTERARTTIEYDNYAADTNHAALVNRVSISGLDPSFTTSYTTRGNATATTHYLLNSSGQITGSISPYSQYDIGGNIVKTIDARGNATTFDYRDNLGSPNGIVQSAGTPVNVPPTELAGQASYAFPFCVINVLGQTAFTKFDYYLGRAVDAEDDNGVVSSSYSDNDSLDRPTKGIVRLSVGRCNQTAPRAYFTDAQLRVSLSPSSLPCRGYQSLRLVVFSLCSEFPRCRRNLSDARDLSQL